MDGENKAVHILPRKPPAESAVSLGWIITFHADDNGGMSALHRSSSLHLPTLLLNYLQNESYRLLQFPQRWPLSVICLTFCSPGDDGNVAEMHTMNTNATKGWKSYLKYMLFMKIRTDLE